MPPFNRCAARCDLPAMLYFGLGAKMLSESGLIGYYVALGHALGCFFGRHCGVVKDLKYGAMGQDRINIVTRAQRERQ